MREEDIFHEALARDPSDRSAYLGRVCPDPAVRAGVEALLRANVGASRFLALPVPDSTAVYTPPTEAPGIVIGPYKLLEELGEGGFGVVYQAEQMHPVRRKVALKVLKPGMDTRQVVARFEAERQALALMEHPNIARVFDGGATPSGRPYFVMELVKGTPITEYCDRNRLPVRDRLELFVQVCQAVQHAHQKGIIHRDIKPSNVLVSRHDSTPVVKVIDFGVAKALGQELTDKTLFTGVAQMIGTPLYMSPEQAGMSDLDVDTRSDIYSLGVLLYELLTGTTPFDKDRFRKVGYDEIRQIIREEEPPRPSTRLSTLAQAATTVSQARGIEPWKLSRLMRGELDWVVMKALEKDRNRRYETASSFGADVQRYLSGEAVQAVPASSGYRLRKFARRNKAALTMTAMIGSAMILAVVVLAISNFWVAGERDQKVKALGEKDDALTKARVQGELARINADEARKQQGIAESETKRAREEEKTARWHLYTARTNLADQARREGQVGLAIKLLEDLRPEPGQDDPRGFEWYYLWRQCHQGHRFTLRGHRDQVYSVAFSPDSKMLASASSDGTVKLWDTATGQVRTTLRHHQWATIVCVAFSPDGGTLASADSDGRLRLWDVAGLGDPIVIEAHAVRAYCLVFSPDGQTIASSGTSEQIPSISGAGRGEVHLWDARTREKRATIDPGAGIPTSLAFSPDSQRLAQAGTSVPIKVWDVTSRKELLQVEGDWVGDSCVAFSPDGKSLAVGEGSARIRVWDLASRQATVLLGHTANVYGVAFSPDGRTLASAGADGSVRCTNLVTKQAQAFGHSGPVRSLAYSPDGKYLATAGSDRTIKLWSLAPEPIPVDQDRPRGAVWSFAFSPDGKTMATASNDEFAVELWDVGTGQVRARLLGHTGTVINVAFAPDGKTLASSAHDNTIRLWDLATGKMRFTMTGHTSNSHGLAFSPDGRTLASGSGDTTVRLWDPSTGQEMAVLKSHSTWVWDLAFSPDGKALASGLFDGVKIWDVATRQLRATLPCRGTGGGGQKLHFSPDGKTLAALTHRQAVELWDLSTHRERATIGNSQVGASLSSLAISKDWNFLAIGHSDGSVSLWDFATGRERATLKGQEPRMWSMALSPDDKTLVTGTWYGKVRFWRAATEEQVLAQSPVRDPREWRAARLASEGLQLLQAGRFPESEKAYRQAMELYDRLAASDPSNPEYRFRQAEQRRQVAYVLGQAEQPGEAEKVCRVALGICEQLIAEFPADSGYRLMLASVHTSLGIALDRQKKHDETFQNFQKAVALNPKNANYHFNLGVNFENLNRMDEAIASFEHAVKLDSRNVMAHHALGNARYAQNRYDDAIVHFRRVIDLDPKHPYAHSNLGLALFERCALGNDAGYVITRESVGQNPRLTAAQPRLAEAVTCFQRALEINPRNATALNGLGRALRLRGELEKATDTLKRAVDLIPDNTRLRYSLGLVHRDRKQYEEALADFSAVIELQPDHEESWSQRHHIYREKWDRALADYTKAIERVPANPVAWCYRGRAHNALRQYDRAEADYTKAIEIKPDYSIALYNRGVMYGGQKQYEQAIADYSRLIELGSKAAGVLYYWALRDRKNIYKTRKQWDLLIADLTRAVESRMLWDAENELAWMLATCPDPKFRDGRRAVAIAKQHLAARPKNWAVWNTLGVSHYRSGEYREAETALRKSLELRKGGDSFDWFFLAMVYWQQDRKDQARRWYDKAVTWMEANKPEDEELIRFRDEATELLGVVRIHGNETAPAPRVKK